MNTNEKDIKFILPLSLLGERENIVKVNNCATRLRLEVKDSNKVNIEEIKKYYPAVQKIGDTQVHIVVGIIASSLANSLRKIIASNDSSHNKALTLIPLLGSRENILKVNNCATRLRIEIKDMNKVNIEELKKHYSSVQKIGSAEVHIVVGTEASELAKELIKTLNMSDSGSSNKSWFLITLLGGIDNIQKVNNCATRLRLIVKDMNKVNTEEIKKYYPSVQVITETEVHIIVGTDVHLLAESLRNLLENQSLKATLLIPLLGGIENILKVNNCATRLRLIVKDMNKVNAEEIKKYYPAVQKISDKEVHIVVGMEASNLAYEFKKFVI